MGEYDLAAAVRFLIETGTAMQLAEVMAREFAAAPPTRDQLAAMAMSALIQGSDPVGDDEDLKTLAQIVAVQAHVFADAMLAQREKGGSRG